MPLSLACPRCHTPLDFLSGPEAICPHDQLRCACLDGIWRFILPERESHFAQFIQEYQTVRTREDRGSTDSAYYQALPFNDLTGRFTGQWRIRAASYQAFLDRVLFPLEQSIQQPLKILDVGAGNGWLSNRLAARSHELAAVDLQTNPTDGLGAYTHYPTTFLRIQAEYEHLPFPIGSLDLVIYNASFHYAEDYASVLAEAFQLLAPKGLVVILDTPIYQSATPGQQMVHEREAEFERRFGFRSNALASENFLTPHRLAELAQTFNLRWQQFAPYYGLRWQLRPWLARLRGHRPPANFKILIGSKTQSVL
jgi:SAM-dependent methyltransferase